MLLHEQASVRVLELACWHLQRTPLQIKAEGGVHGGLPQGPSRQRPVLHICVYVVCVCVYTNMYVCITYIYTHIYLFICGQALRTVIITCPTLLTLHFSPWPTRLMRRTQARNQGQQQLSSLLPQGHWCPRRGRSAVGTIINIGVEHMICSKNPQSGGSCADPGTSPTPDPRVDRRGASSQDCQMCSQNDSQM